MLQSRRVFVLAFLCLWSSWLHAAEVLPRGWPKLPKVDGSVEIPAQEWPIRPVPRHVKVSISYPYGQLDRVTEKTGLMLTLHNWGGVDAVGTADPKILSERLDVVAITVDYLQSGKYEGFETSEPYDFGYFQSLDSLRGLWYVHQGLRSQEILFNAGRIYVVGGSAGGHVALMCNKLAPRTFTCVVDMCGLCKLSDDVAYGLPGGSSFNARWKREVGHRFFLSDDDREIRAIGNPRHLTEMKRLGQAAKVIVVHGTSDNISPFAEAKEMVAAMKGANINVEPVFVDKPKVDGKVFTDTGHSLGQRTEIVFRVAEKYMRPGSTSYLERKTSSDFFLREEIRYETTNGAYLVSYENGYPIGRFEPN